MSSFFMHMLLHQAGLLVWHRTFTKNILHPAFVLARQSK